MEKINIEGAVENYRKFIVDFNKFIQSDEYKRIQELAKKYKKDPSSITEKEIKELSNIKVPEFENVDNSTWLSFLHLLSTASNCNNLNNKDNE